MIRVPGLRGLSDDQHTGVVLARRCKQVDRPNSGPSREVVWKQVLDVFSGHLEPHFQIEEEHLLPALESIGDSSRASRIPEENRALRALQSQAADPPGARPLV